MVSQFDVSHFRARGELLAVVFVGPALQRLKPLARERALSDLRRCAQAAGLAGTVVPVWEGGAGELCFLAPQPWHAFFENTSLGELAESVNTRLSCRRLTEDPRPAS